MGFCTTAHLHLFYIPQALLHQILPRVRRFFDFQISQACSSFGRRRWVFFYHQRTALILENLFLQIITAALTTLTPETVIVSLRSLSPAGRATVCRRRLGARARAPPAAGLRTAPASCPGRPGWPAAVYCLTVWNRLKKSRYYSILIYTPTVKEDPITPKIHLNCNK